MNLQTTYMGFDLPHPVVPGASPLSGNLDMARRLEDAGAPLLVMSSLFEEQIVREEVALNRAFDLSRDLYAESLGFFSDYQDFDLGPDDYLEHLARLKDALGIPVIASLNGNTAGGWLRYAKLIEQAGADGLELNLYGVATDMDASGAEIERRALDVVRSVREQVKLPLAVKLSPFYSSLPYFARQLDRLGIQSLVLFNRFYEPDIDVEQLEVASVLHLSDSSELLLRVRWLGVLFGRVKASLAVTGGVHTPLDAVKSVMAGASAVQLASALLKHGPGHLTRLRDGLAHWLEEHEYDSLAQMCGSMSLLRCPSPGAYERANYVRILQTWDQESL